MLPILTPTDFIALANQTLEFAYPSVEIEGEVKNFKISRGKWVYFDVADDTARIRCFGTVFILPAPIEDGMKVRVVSAPRLHPQFGFSLNMQSLQLSGEGTIKKASDLLRAQLEKEGLFAVERKRTLPYPPNKIGLITSQESAAYKDFIKVLSARFGGLEIELADVQVQGGAAAGQLVKAIEWFNRQADTCDVLVIVRGGGSADDLQAFSSEQVTRAVAASRIPTLVAIGHEVDLSLAELAADLRASTPSNAAELLVPNRIDLLARLDQACVRLDELASAALARALDGIDNSIELLHTATVRVLDSENDRADNYSRTLEALSPQAVLKRGYMIARKNGRVVKSVSQIKTGDEVELQLADGKVKTEVK